MQVKQDQGLTETKTVNRVTASYLVAAIVLSTLQPALAAAPARIGDVGLNSNGALVGQVVDSQGQAVVGAGIEIKATGREAINAVSNGRGYFSVNNLPAGVYVASSEGTSQMVRVWSHRTAPPAAAQGILLVKPERVSRGDVHSHLDFAKEHCLKIALGLGIAAGIWAIADNPSGS